MSSYLKHKEETEQIIINVRDLCAKVVKKTWLIIICMLVFGIALCAGKYFLDVKAYNAHQGADAEQVESTTEGKANLLQTYENRLREQVEYVGTSVLMNINANEANVVSLQYYVNAPDDEVASAVAWYKDFVERGALVQELNAENSKLSVKYLDEIIVLNINDIKAEEAIRIFSVDVYGMTKEECEVLAEEVNQKLLGIKMPADRYSCELLHKSSSVRAEDWIKEHQIRQRTQLETIQSQYTSLKTNVELEGFVLGTEDNVDVTVAKPSISIVYFILGAIVGAFLAVALICVEYFFSQRLKYTTEIYFKTGLNCFGEQIVSRRTVWEKIADSLFYKERLMDAKDKNALIASKIAALCKNNQFSSVQLIGDFEQEAGIVLQGCLEDVQKHGIKVQVLGNILSDINTIEEIDSTSSVILVETLEKTKYQTVAHEITFCEEQNIRILGYISLV